MSGRAAIRHLTLCVSVVALAACAHRGPAPAAPAPLRVAVPGDTPPYAFHQEGQLVGLEVDFAREMATALGRPLELLEFDWRDLIPALRSGRADVIMAGMTITPARQVLVAFSDPYVRSGLLATMRREDAARFKTTRSVLSTTDPIGIVEGTTADRFVRERAPTASVSAYPSVLSAIRELRQRRVMLVVHDAPVAVWFAAGDEANLAVLLELLNQEDLGWAFRQDDQTLRADVNAVLARWRTDGTRERILGRWIPYWQRLESGTAGR
jgi:polar amino acid transport system substrate-binding protein